MNAIVNIVDLELAQVLKRTKEMGYSLSLDASAKEFLAKKGYDVQFGARPLKRAIQNFIEDELSELILSQSIGEGDTISVTADGENDKLRFDVTKE